jgi:hypothetical protein
MIQIPGDCPLCGAPWTTASVIEQTKVVKTMVEGECMEGHTLIFTATTPEAQEMPEAQEIYDWAASGD